MATCFVIQPFDNGKFDKRYDDTFSPAIRNAGLEPYRIDRDPKVSIPIEDIEKGIREAAICLIDITLDNPNVWFELGYALACSKPICLICSKERTAEKFPFDIRHRKIIHYEVDSPSDFEVLKSNITTTIKAILDNKAELTNMVTSSLLKEMAGLSQHEIITLCSIMQSRDGVKSDVSHWTVSQDMESMGYNKLAVNIGLERLVQKHFIQSAIQQGNSYDDEYVVYSITSSGIEWLLNNEDKLTFKTETKLQAKPTFTLDEEIPF